MEVIELKGGLVLPVDVVSLALDLENRGFEMQVDGDTLRLKPFARADGTTSTLTDADRTAIRQWKRHLLTLADYHVPEEAVADLLR